MKTLTIFAFLSLLFGWTGNLEAAKPLARLDQEIKNNSESASVLAGYPENVRQAAMEAAAHPSALWDLEQRQSQSQEAFQRLISSYPRKTQEQVYELVRYPNLVGDLVDGGQKSKGQINDLTKDYSQKVQDAAQDLGRKNYDLLRSVRDLYGSTDQDFANSMKGLPSTTQSAYRTLMNEPELLKELGENRNFTTALGDAYRSDPNGTRAKFDQLNRTVAQQKEEALEDYRETLENNPEAREEAQEAARSFAGEYGYDEDDYNYAPPSNTQTVVSINVNPYPYWFGYPYWYASPFWRPYPLWWYTGFWGWGSSFYAWGFPSYYYTSWFYGYPGNFYYYPNLAGCYGGFYNRWYGRPYYYSGFNRAVNNYRYRNQVSSNMFRNDANSANRWRQFGQSEMTRQRQSGGTSSFAGQQRGSSQEQIRSRGRNGNPSAVGAGSTDQRSSFQRSSMRSRDQGKVFSTQRQRGGSSGGVSGQSRSGREIAPKSGQSRGRPVYNQSSGGVSAKNAASPSYSSGASRSRPTMDSGGYSGASRSGGSSSFGGSSGGGSRSSGGFSSGGGHK